MKTKKKPNKQLSAVDLELLELLNKSKDVANMLCETGTAFCNDAIDLGDLARKVAEKRGFSQENYWTDFK